MRPQLLLLALVYIATAFAVPVAKEDTEEVSVGAEAERAIF